VSNQACYVAYEDGRITAILSGPRGVITPPEEPYIDYLGDQEITHDFYVSDGNLVQKPTRPSQAYVFNYIVGVWELDLTEARQLAWNRIKQARDAEEFGTFAWSTHTFQCDETSQRRIQGAVQLAQLDSTTTLDWTLADNSVQTFNATELQQIGQALAAHVNACHVKSRTKRGEIDAATTEAELDAITW
jgi:hypothetical protein